MKDVLKRSVIIVCQFIGQRKSLTSPTLPSSRVVEGEIILNQSDFILICDHRLFANRAPIWSMSHLMSLHVMSSCHLIQGFIIHLGEWGVHTSGHLASSVISIDNVQRLISPAWPIWHPRTFNLWFTYIVDDVIIQNRHVGNRRYGTLRSNFSQVNSKKRWKLKNIQEKSVQK